MLYGQSGTRPIQFSVFNDNFHITVQDLQKSQELADGLAVIGLIKQAIELRC
jgi:hypothetical protein